MLQALLGRIDSGLLKLIDVTKPEFGAIGDGCVDDTAAIQRALHYARDQWPSTVYFPRGRYLVSAMVTLEAANYVRVWAPDALFMEPAGLRILPATFRFLNCTNCGWYGGQVAGSNTQAALWTIVNGDNNYVNNADNLATFLLLDGCTDAVVQGIKIAGKERGVRLWSCTRGMVDDFQMQGILLGTLQPLGGGTDKAVCKSLYGVNVSGGADYLIRNARVYSASGAILSGSTVGLPRRIDCDGIFTKDSEDNGIYISSAEACTVIGGHHERVPWNSAVKLRGNNHRAIGVSAHDVYTGFVLESLGTADAYGFGAAGHQVIGSSVSKCKRSAVGTDEQGPNFVYPRDLLIDDCYFVDCGYDTTGSPSDLNRAPIKLEKGLRYAVTNTTIEGGTTTPPNYAMHIGRVSDSPGTDWYFGHRIENNTFVNVRQGIRLYGIAGGVVRNNRGYLIAGGTPPVLLRCEHVMNTTFFGNEISPAGGRLLETVANTVFSGNRFVDSKNVGAILTSSALSSFLPSDLPQTVLWLDAGNDSSVLKTSRIIATNGESVEYWIDRLSGLEFVQTTSSKKPTLITNGGVTSNKRVLRFDGGDILRYAGELCVAAKASKGEVFIVAKRTDTASTLRYYFASADEGTDDAYLAYGHEAAALDHVRYDQTNTGADLMELKTVNGSAVDGTWYVVNIRTSGTAIAFEVNGSSVAQGTPVTGTDNGDWWGETGTSLYRENVTVGGIRNTVGGVLDDRSLFNGDIAAIIVCESELTTTERTNMTTYLKSTAGI